MRRFAKKSGNVYAYLSIPYFHVQQELNQEISSDYCDGHPPQRLHLPDRGYHRPFHHQPDRRSRVPLISAR